MNTQDIKSFFTDEELINKDDYLIFTYVFETAIDPMEAAAHLCSESSTAQWSRPGVDEDFRPRHAAKVLNLETLEELAVSSLGFVSAGGEKFQRVRVRIAHPHINFGPRIPNILTAALGEGAFHCNGIVAIKLIDIEFPDSFLANFQGPRFGTKGIRNALDVFDRPLFFGVVKPNVGLDPQSFAKIAREAWEGGLDVAKDDEMLADAGYSPFAERMKIVGRAMREAEQTTGEKKMFIANITDETDRLAELHDVAAQNGINAVMVNVMAVGLSSVRALRKHASVPIVAHFDCIAPMSRHPYYGISSALVTKLERLCGCDAIIMPGFGPRMMTPDEEVLANAAECTKPFGQIKSALPVPGGSDWAGTLKIIYDKLRTLDFAMVPGRGVFNHPMGPKAGATSLCQAWNALVQKIPINEYASDHIELREAINAFGKETQAPTVLQSPQRAEKQAPLIQGFTGVQISFERN